MNDLSGWSCVREVPAESGHFSGDEARKAFDFCIANPGKIIMRDFFAYGGACQAAGILRRDQPSDIKIVQRGGRVYVWKDCL
jgi:hypothetical protein